MVANLSEPFVVQYNLRWIVVFPIFFQELKPVQEEASLHFIKRKDVFAVLPFWMREFSDLSNRSEGMCIFARSRVQLS